MIFCTEYSLFPHKYLVLLIIVGVISKLVIDGTIGLAIRGKYADKGEQGTWHLRRTKTITDAICVRDNREEYMIMKVKVGNYEKTF